MIHLGKACATNKMLRSSTLVQLRHSSGFNESKNESLTSPEKNATVSVSSGQDISLLSGSALPEEPTTCCMSGCANCVWIEYADQICKAFESGEKAREIVLSKVTDPNMKAFLLMELKALENKKESS